MFWSFKKKNPQKINSEPDMYQQDPEPSLHKKGTDWLQTEEASNGNVREHGTAHKDCLPKLHLANFFQMSEVQTFPGDSYKFFTKAH